MECSKPLLALLPNCLWLFHSVGRPPYPFSASLDAILSEVMSVPRQVEKWRLWRLKRFLHPHSVWRGTPGTPVKVSDFMPCCSAPGWTTSCGGRAVLHNTNILCCWKQKKEKKNLPSKQKPKSGRDMELPVIDVSCMVESKYHPLSQPLENSSSLLPSESADWCSHRRGKISFMQVVLYASPKKHHDRLFQLKFLWLSNVSPTNMITFYYFLPTGGPRASALPSAYSFLNTGRIATRLDRSLILFAYKTYTFAHMYNVSLGTVSFH